MIPPSSQDEEHSRLMDEEEDELLSRASTNLSVPATNQHAADHRKVDRHLYVSHFLSMWNSRVFEFGSVLYLAVIFPQTLLPMSAYAMARGLSAVCLSSTAGRYIDRGDRLEVVRLSIVLQRLAVAVSCPIFLLLVQNLAMSPPLKLGLLGIVVVLACIEKLCAIMNTVAVERDWAVVIADGHSDSLQNLNAQLRQIDLGCKLLGPLFIALLTGISTSTAILVNFGMNTASIALEYWCIAKVHDHHPALQAPKPPPPQPQPEAPPSWLGSLTFYTTHRLFPPSLALSLLYLSLLSFSSQMTTYLLSLPPYTPTTLSLLRTLSTLFELSATVLAPRLIARLGAVRAALWFSSLQALTLLCGAVPFLVSEFQPKPGIASLTTKNQWPTHALVLGTIVSRLGLWGVDLCVSTTALEEVAAADRGAFSAAEAAWQNGFELASFGVTMVFDRPDEFRVPAGTSLAAVVASWGVMTWWVRRRRGHLVHLGRCWEGEKGRAEEGGGVEMGRWTGERRLSG